MEFNSETHIPLVSVLIPTYNAGKYLRPALESILSQSYSKLEIFIIDDGCTDGCLDTIRDILDDRLRILHQVNSGKATALNNALDLIQGDFWLIQDADDLSYSNRIQKLIHEMLKNPELAAVYTGHDLLINAKQFAPSFSPLNREQCKEEVLNCRIPAHDATGMYRTKFVKNIRFDPELRIGQGIDFIFQVGEKLPITRLGDCLYTYRINYQSTIRKEPEKNAFWINTVMRKTFDRRGVTGNTIKDNIASSYKTPRRASNNHIVSHCITSVIDFKKERQLLSAFRVGYECAKRFPLDYYFYKPLCFAFVPLSAINIYRYLKKLIRIISRRNSLRII